MDILKIITSIEPTEPLRTHMVYNINGMCCSTSAVVRATSRTLPKQSHKNLTHAQCSTNILRKRNKKRREETHEMKAAAGNSNGAFLSFLPSAATLSSPPPSRARRTKSALRRKRGVSEDERKISFFVSSSSSSSGSGSGSGGGKRNALREKERRKREEERRTKTTTGSKSGRKPARRANGGGKKRNYERELEDALRRHRASSSFSSPSAALEEGSEFGEKKPTAAAVAVKDTKRRVKKALKKAKRFAKRNVQKATDVLLPSRSSLGGGRGRGDGGPVRFTPSTPSSSTSYYAYRQQQPNIFGLTGAAGAIAGWSMLIGLAYVVVKVMNGERVIPRGGFQLNIPGLRGSNLNKRNSNEGGKWVIDRSLGGRKVWVPDGDASRRGSKLSDRSALDEVYYGSSSSSPTSSSTSTKSRISRTIEDEDEEKEKQNLPTWWVESPFLRTSIGGIDKQRKADLLQDAKRSASYLSAARINGVQWTSDMILDFHTACATALKCYPYEEKNKYRLSIAKSVGPENARVQLYRQASEIAVEDCVGNRSGASSSFGMDVNIFVVGLSYFLNIPTKAAINIVRSSCAVKIRNLLLASCSALRKEREELTSPSADLLLSLFSIVSVLNVFPFTENSAEIEMINEGFKTRITEKERNNLLMAYRQISDGVGDRTIEEALR